MGAPQIQITNLPLAGPASNDDYTIIRQGVSDFKIKLGDVRNIDVASYPLIGTPAESDVLMINRGAQNYKIRFDRVGFVAGTVMWFYQNSPPLGWETVDALGDALLAVRGGNGKYKKYGPLQGSWQQSNHALTVDQMPAHTHRVIKTKDKTGASNNLGPARGKGIINEYFTTESTGGEGSTASLGLKKKALGHNHGDTWRPLANVGVLGRKLP